MYLFTWVFSSSLHFRVKILLLHLMQDTQKLTRGERDEQYYKPYLDAYYRFKSLKVKEAIVRANRELSVIEEFDTAINHPAAILLLHLLIYPLYGIINILQRYVTWVTKTERERRIKNEETLDYDYTLDKRLRQIDTFTRRKFNFELFRSSTRPDYLTRLKQKTEEMNNTQLSYEDELGI